MSESAKPSRVMALVRRRPLVLLFLICLLAWVPGLFTIPPLDRDESRFAQASKQMLETRNFVDIRFGQEPRYKKPVGIYWLQAAATEIASPVTNGARDQIWTYRIPSLLGALAAVALVYWCASAFLSIEGAFLSALLMGLTLLLSSEAKIAKTDAVLLATVVGAQAVLMRAYLARDPEHTQLTFRTAMLGWLSFALGILIKGPVILGVCGMTLVVLLVWDREWRWLGKLKPLWGVLLTILIVAPWLIAIALQSHGAFYQQSLGHDFGAKLAGGQESHGEPPGYYLLLTIATLWPATLFVIPALAATILQHRAPAARFLLAWAGGPWLMFEAVPTKLPHYIMPAYPALAMMAAAFVLAAREEGLPTWRRVLPVVSSVQFLIGAALLAAAIVVVPRLYGPGASWDLIAAAAAVALLAIAAAFAMLRGAKPMAAALATATVIVTYPTMTLLAVPKTDRLWVSPHETAMIRAHLRPHDPAVVLAGYTEPSAMFLLGTGTHLTNGYGAAEIGAAQGGLAAVEEGQRPAFLAHLAELEADAIPIDSIEGFNYSRGRPVHITLYRVTPPRQETSPPPE
ncbi:MAG TPA: glycosyltransferase family 39 protein [Rhizomicrobium sp.]|nr:glycosyltransferase family 39 protein [Rhizomicrobium sp.]